MLADAAFHPKFCRRKDLLRFWSLADILKFFLTRRESTMDEPEKLQTTPISSADLRRRAAILRQIATLFDGIAAQMDNSCIAPIEMKGAATFERAIVFLRGSVNTAMQENIDKTLAEIKQQQEEQAAVPPPVVYAFTPDQGEPPAPDYKRMPRIWTSGKSSVEASYRFIVGSKITIQRTDNGKEVAIEISKLSEEDQAWIRENAK